MALLVTGWLFLVKTLVFVRQVASKEPLKLFVKKNFLSKQRLCEEILFSFGQHITRIDLKEEANWLNLSLIDIKQTIFYSNVITNDTFKVTDFYQVFFDKLTHLLVVKRKNCILVESE